MPVLAWRSEQWLGVRYFLCNHDNVCITARMVEPFGTNLVQWGLSAGWKSNGQELLYQRALARAVAPDSHLQEFFESILTNWAKHTLAGESSGKAMMRQALRNMLDPKAALPAWEEKDEDE